jgi:hypothetical protein
MFYNVAKVQRYLEMGKQGNDWGGWTTWRIHGVSKQGMQESRVELFNTKISHSWITYLDKNYNQLKNMHV